MSDRDPREHPEPLDRLDALLRRFPVRARQFSDGALCETRRLDALPGRGFLHVLRGGSLAVATGSDPEPRVFSEPSVLFYPRAVEHTLLGEAEAPVDLACATLDFDGGVSHPLVSALPELVVVAIVDVPGLDGLLELLDRERAEARCGHRHVIDRLFELVLFALLRHLLDRPDAYGLPPGIFGGFGDPHIARALAAIHQEPGEAWTLDRLARTARMSRSAFAARFRELVQASPHDYLIAWRMTVGKQLLRERQPVTRVAAELGYTGSSFSRVFAQREGASPRAWAERELSGEEPRETDDDPEPDSQRGRR